MLQPLTMRSQFGQLSYPSPSCPGAGSMAQTFLTNPVMHTFYLARSVYSSATEYYDITRPSTVLQRLNLGVGETGIVGRTVSVLDEHQFVIGEGILGWN